MVESLNSQVDLVIDATSYTGLTDYGQIMIGDKGFEFYHSRDARKYIQIPWEEIDYVVASVIFKGKWIPRYAIQTQRNGTFTFASKEPKKVLRTIRKYIAPEHMVQSIGFFDVLKRAIQATWKKVVK